METADLHGFSCLGQKIDNVDFGNGNKISFESPATIASMTWDGVTKRTDDNIGRYARHYKHDGVQTVDVIEKVVGYLDEASDIDGIDAERASHMLKYALRAGHKDNLDLDCYKCADWMHRLLTGKFLNEVGVRYE